MTGMTWSHVSWIDLLFYLILTSYRDRVKPEDAGRPIGLPEMTVEESTEEAPHHRRAALQETGQDSVFEARLDRGGGPPDLGIEEVRKVMLFGTPSLLEVAELLVLSLGS